MKFAKFLPVALIMIWSACSDSNKSDNDNNATIEFESFAYDVVVRDSTASDLSALSHHTGRGVLPVRIGNSDISQLRDSLIKLTGVSFNPHRQASPLLDPGCTVTSSDPDKTDAGSFMTNELFVVLNTNTLIVWQNYFEGYAYGAAHGIYSTSYVNYCLRHNRIITLPDIMKKGYEKPLTALIREKLSDNQSLLVSLDEISIPDQFRITPDGIDFIYGVYEIAPYSSGEIVVSFHTYELQDLLTKEALGMIGGPSY